MPRVSSHPVPGDDLPALIARVGGGDEAAVRALLTHYLDDLHRYVHQKAGRELLAREASGDLVQSACREVLEDAAKGHFAYRDESRFRAFLFRAALNKIRGKGRFHGRERRNNRREVPVQSTGASVADTLFQTLRTPSHSAVEREERASFLAAFGKLTETQQQMIQWARIDGLSHRDIGDRLGVSEGNSRQLLARALARLASLAAGPSEAP